ncbi:hypothetical protein A3K80_08565 [Candidatus Bathyarchaeota archaeon RBG_13_38_9]|nr:MAG: hypothetical protein A3K80_08565 [Candidatus Bathyarchaeota archaeon RBG_13_38_9]
MSDEIVKSNSKYNVKTFEIIRDYRILFCRDPQPEEIALEADITPEKAKEVLEKLTLSKKWCQPIEIDKLKAQEKARRRLELASWLELGCRNSSYLKKWSNDEFSKAETIRNQYSDCLPKIRRNKFDNNDIQVNLLLFWPELSWPIIGEPKNGVKFFEGKISDQTTIMEHKLIPKKDLNDCLKKIPIIEETIQ